MPRKRGDGDGGLYYVASKKMWRGVVDVGFWPDGRRKQKWVYSKSQKEARRKLDELKAELAKYGDALDRKTTVAVWADHWLSTVCRPTLKPNTYNNYESTIRTWISPRIGAKTVASLKPSDVRLVLKSVIDKGRSSSTALKTYNVLSGMLEAARMDGLSERNVAADVVTPKAAESSRGALSTDDALAVLKTAAEDREGTRWWVALLAGLRQAERLGAQLESLDLDAGVLHVDWVLEEVMREHGCGQIENGSWACGKKQGAACPQARFKLPNVIKHRHLYGRLFLLLPKSNKVRTVPLVPELAEALRRYVIATADRPNPFGLIWRHEDGTPFLPHEDEQMWRDVLFNAGIITQEQTLPPRERPAGTPDIPTGHWARHTTATVMMELGVDAKIVGEIVGHVDEKTTRRYQHVSSPAAREAMGRLGEHYAKALTSPDDPSHNA